MNVFTKNILSTCACALLFTPASAQFLAREAQVKNMAKSAAVSLAPNVKSEASDSCLKLLSVKKAKKAQSVDYSQYGTQVMVADEDLSTMKTGKVGAPDLKTELHYTREDGNAWMTMVPGYMKNDGWGCENVYPAGGTACLYLDPEDNSAFAHLNTCMFDVSGYNGAVIVQFDAYTANEGEVNEYVGVEAAETNNMGPSWDILGSTRLPAVTNVPQTYTILFQGGGKSSIFNIYTSKYQKEMYGDVYGTSVYLDNIKIYQIDQYVGYPLTLSMKYYRGTSFTLDWDKVEGAEKYLVDVYTKDANGNIKDYLLQDEEASENKLEVTGAENGTVYYFKVRGVKGNHVSLPSEEAQVLGVATPELKPVESPVNDKYTASWDAVPAAEAYNYEAFALRKADKDCTMTLADINFVGMPYNKGFVWKDPNLGDLTEPYYTVDDPDYYTLSFVAFDYAPGWCAYTWALYKDALVIDGYHSYYNNNNASLQCADMDLSKDGGKFSVDARVSAEAINWSDEGGNETYVYARPAFVLFNYDKDADEYVQSETYFVKDLTEDWKNVHFDFTKGTSKSVFGMFATYAPGAIYTQTLKMTQNYKAGEEYLEPFFYAYRKYGVPDDATDVTNEKYPVRSVEVELPANVDGKDVYHRVQSVRVESEAQQMTNATFAESYWSETSLAANNVHTGIEQATLNSSNFASLTMQGNNLVVNNPKGLDIHVYTVDGTEVMNDKSGDSTVKMAAPQSGTYILKAGKQSIKFTL